MEFICIVYSCEAALAVRYIHTCLVLRGEEILLGMSEMWGKPHLPQFWASLISATLFCENVTVAESLLFCFPASSFLSVFFFL